MKMKCNYIGNNLNSRKIKMIIKIENSTIVKILKRKIGNFLV